MEAFSIVNDIKEVCDTFFGFLEISVLVNINLLLLECFEKAFDLGITIGVSF